LSTSLDSPIVQICVGRSPCQKTFYIHEALITGRSEFFKTSLNGKWAESDNRIINLPEDAASVFEHYAHLLYTGRVLSSTTMTPTLDDFGKLFELYILSEKLQDPQSKKATTEAIFNKWKGSSLTWYSNRTSAGNGRRRTLFTPVYNGTPDGCLIRKLLIDLSLYIVDDTFLNKHQNSLSPEFMRDLATRLLQSRNMTEIQFRASCTLDRYLEKAVKESTTQSPEEEDGVSDSDKPVRKFGENVFALHNSK